jgi:hypothetical protein
VIGEEQRPLNLFDADNETQQGLLEATLRRMRKVTTDLLG